MENSRFMNRELSWLDFNFRVIEQAALPTNPLLERVRFLSISADNLDEFYSVRVAALVGLRAEGAAIRSPEGLTPAEQLHLIQEKVALLTATQQKVWRELKNELRQKGIGILRPEELTTVETAFLETYFEEQIFPVLTPMAIDRVHPFPPVPDRRPVMAFKLRRHDDLHEIRVVLPLPHKIDRFIRPSRDKNRFVLLEDVIRLFLHKIFSGYTVIGEGVFRLIRDTDVVFEEEAEDLIRSYEQALKRRPYGNVIHLVLHKKMPADLQELAISSVFLPQEEIVIGEGLLGLSDIKQLIGEAEPGLLFPPFTPCVTDEGRAFENGIPDYLRQRDLLVHHPYESFDIVVHFLEQAAADPDVVAIKQTLYRTSRESPIVKALIKAANAGKAVTAVVEIRARFDEEANIRLALELKAAGVQVVYGADGLKTHAKISLVVRREGEVLRSYVHFGTGNYHPITARVYTDLSLFTADPAFTRDALRLFNFITGYAVPEKTEVIFFSPLSVRKTLEALILEEISHAKAGKPAFIRLKMNALVDAELIDYLYQASQAGVKINLIIRGICCLYPGVPGLSENIEVKSVVGRFLEHSRIFIFGNGCEPGHRDNKVFISSADWMPRNMDRRIEAMVPVTDPAIHQRVLHIIEVHLKDNTHSSFLDEKGLWHYRPVHGEEAFSAHEAFMKEALKSSLSV